MANPPSDDERKQAAVEQPTNNEVPQEDEPEGQEDSDDLQVQESDDIEEAKEADDGDVARAQVQVVEPPQLPEWQCTIVINGTTYRCYLPDYLNRKKNPQCPAYQRPNWPVRMEFGNVLMNPDTDNHSSTTAWEKRKDDWMTRYKFIFEKYIVEFVRFYSKDDLAIDSPFMTDWGLIGRTNELFAARKKEIYSLICDKLPDMLSNRKGNLVKEMRQVFIGKT